MHRRSALAALFVGAPVLWRQQGQRGTDSATSHLGAPDLAGRPQSRVTPFDNNPDIVAIEQKLRCTCGCNLSVYTCRTTDFTCETSPAMHQDVIQLYQQHQTAEQILAAFVAKDGETVLMAPPREGFNLVAYYLPGTVIALAGAIILFSFQRRRRVAAAQAPAVNLAGAGLSADDAARLEDELKRLGQ
jgi:cytochrome c-type biogenesis protein CcmH